MGIEATYSYGVFPYSAAKKVASQVLCSNLKVSLRLYHLERYRQSRGVHNIPYCLTMAWRLSYSACDMAIMGVGEWPLFSADVLFFDGGVSTRDRTKADTEASGL